MLAGGKPEQAQPLLAAAAAEPGFALADFATMRLAASFYDRKQYREAAAVYASLPQKFPKSTYATEAWLNAGKCYYLADQFAEAAAPLANARAAGGKTARMPFTGSRRATWGRSSRPKPCVCSTVAIAGGGADPAVVQLELDRADGLYAMPGQQKQAAAAYRDVAVRHPDDPSCAPGVVPGGFHVQRVG